MAKFRIGPLTTYAEPAAMRDWLQSARAGEESIYACGPYLADHPAKRLAAEWQARGLVELYQRKIAPGRFNYQMRKKAGAGLAPRRDAPMGEPPGDPSWRHSIEGRLYELLCEVANDRRPCPTNDALAETLGLSDRHAVRYRFNNLVRSGLIAVVEPNRFGTRVIMICASGRRSAPSGCEPRRAAAR